MGCDIHSVVQIRQEDGSWLGANASFYNNRSYSLFGLLANVRNYSNIPVISSPRGLPDDIQLGRDKYDEYDISIDGVWLGDHSYTWYTLDELLKFDYTQKFVDRRVGVMLCGGQVTLQFADNSTETFKKSEQPPWWDGWLSVSAEKALEHGQEYRILDRIQDEYFSVLTNLKALGNPKNIRIIMGFDN